MTICSIINKMFSNKIICFIIVFLLLTFKTINGFFYISALEYIDEIFILLFFILALLQIVYKKKANKLSLKIIALTIIFLLIGIISCKLNSNFIIKDVMASAFIAIKFILLIFSIMNIDIAEKSKETIIKNILLIEKIAIFFGIINLFVPNLYYNFFYFLTPSYKWGVRAITSIFIHQQTFGWFMLFCTIIHLSKYKKNKNKKEIIYGIISTVFCILSFRTKAIIGSIAIWIIYFSFFNMDSMKKYVKNIFIIILLILITVTFFSDFILNTYKLYYTSENGTSARQALRDGGYKILKDYFPLGVGFGKFASWYARVNYSEHYYKYGLYKYYGLTPENPSFATDTYWPAILGETGIVGTGIFIYILYCILKNLIFLYKRNSKLKYNVNQQIIFISILMMIQSLLESFGEPSFNSSPQNIFLGLFVGLAFGINYKTSDNK